MARRWVLLAATLGAALVLIDVTAMNVVAPVIQRELEAPVSILQWVINAYTLFLASILLLGGALADRFGRRRVFAVGAALFTTASLACAAAPTASALVVARSVQGLGGALLLPAGLALLAAHYPGADRGRALGLWGGLSGLAAVAGPLLGGALADFLSWRWVFVMYAPVGVFLLFVIALRVPAARLEQEQRRLDVPGALLATLGLFALVFALIRAGVAGWQDHAVIAGLMFGPLFLALFILHERRSPAPLLDPRRFMERDFGGALLVTFLVFFALAAGMLFVPMRLMYLDGWRPALAGAGAVPSVLLIALVSPRAGVLLERLGARVLIAGGAAVSAAGYVVLALAPAGSSYWAATFWGLALVGLGMAFVIAPVTATVLGSVPGVESARAAGVNNAVSRLGALLAIAVAGIIALAAQGGVVLPAIDALGLSPEETQAARAGRLDLAAAEPPAGMDSQTADALAAIYRDGFLAGYRAVQLTMATASFLGALAAFALLTRRAGRGGEASAGIPGA